MNKKKFESINYEKEKSLSDKSMKEKAKQLISRNHFLNNRLKFYRKIFFKINLIIIFF